MYKIPRLLYYRASILLILHININLIKAATEEEIQSASDLTQNFFDSLQNDPRLFGEYLLSYNQT